MRAFSWNDRLMQFFGTANATGSLTVCPTTGPLLRQSTIIRKARMPRPKVTARIPDCTSNLQCRVETFVTNYQDGTTRKLIGNSLS